MKKESVFFPNLNGVRFFAALMVIVHHIEQFKVSFNIEGDYSDNVFGITHGGLGVTLFFCLSGFLITYLLLAERKESGTVSIRNFYIRRVLRIWPLYFLIIFLAFAVLNRSGFFYIPEIHGVVEGHYWSLLASYLTFTPNYLVFLVMPYAGISWSIGVEEQFYAVWPLLMKYSKTALYAVVAIGVIFAALNPVVDFILPRYVSDRTLYAARVLLTANRFDCMAVGAVFAHILYQQRTCRFLRFIFRRDIQAVIYLTAFCLLIRMPVIPGAGHMLYAVVFSMIILNLAANDRSVVNLENPLFDYLGRISYGLYMFHPIVVFACIKTAVSPRVRSALGLDSMVRFNMCVYSAAVILTILVAALSYHLYEKRFLRLKKAFSILISGDNARETV